MPGGGRQAALAHAAPSGPSAPSRCPQAQQLSELQDFAEVERSTLLDKVAELEAALAESQAAGQQAAQQRDEGLARLKQLEAQELEAQQQVGRAALEQPGPAY
jgi:hypothetical protein